MAAPAQTRTMRMRVRCMPAHADGAGPCRRQACGCPVAAAQVLWSAAGSPHGCSMAEHRIYGTAFAKVYPMYVQKAERKGRTRGEVDQLIRWLTGYSQEGLQAQLDRQVDLRGFFAEAPAIHPNARLITGVVCGIRVEEIEDPLMQQIRWLDKLVDEL